MYCSECGRENRDSAKFCKGCGLVLEAEEETVVASRGDVSDGEEIEVFSIRPTLKFVIMGYVFAVLAAFVVAVLLATLGPLFTAPVSSGIVVLLGIAMLLVPAYYHVRQKAIKYTLTDSKVEIDRGLLAKTTRNVPLRIIQDVTVSASLSQRLLGLGNVEIENANESDDLIVLKNIDSPNDYADTLLDEMRRNNK